MDLILMQQIKQCILILGMLDILRTLLATYYYRDSIDHWKRQGRDFTHHFYVPEINAITNEVHYEKCDHGHLLKRIAGM